MSADENTPVLPVTDASARESFMYAQLAVRGVRTDSIGTALTVELSKAWDTYLDGVKAEAVAALSTPPADDVREALAQPPSDALIVDALTAFYGEERDAWSMGKVRRMRAALTAVAAEVRPHGTVTPPADDVREACVRLLGHVFHGEHFKRTATVVEVSDLRLVLDALTAAEVRPHGTVTDVEVDAALSSLIDSAECYVGHTPQGVRAALEAAREVHP